jgi:hypothetical protein
MLLGGSFLAVVGAALRQCWLTALSATATLVAAAAPYAGYGTDVAIAHTPYPLLLAVVPFLLAVTLMRRAGRMGPG